MPTEYTREFLEQVAKNQAGTQMVHVDIRKLETRMRNFTDDEIAAFAKQPGGPIVHNEPEDELGHKLQTHGVYEEVANIQDGLLAVMEQSRNWPHMPPAYRGAVRQIANLFGRIGSGDMHLPKHWSDGVNYMRLALMTAEGQQPQDLLTAAYGKTKMGTVASRPSVEAPLAAQEAHIKATNEYGDTSYITLPSGLRVDEASYLDPLVYLYNVYFDGALIGHIWAMTPEWAVQKWVKKSTGEWPVLSLSKTEREKYVNRFGVVFNPEGDPPAPEPSVPQEPYDPEELISGDRRDG